VSQVLSETDDIQDLVQKMMNVPPPGALSEQGTKLSGTLLQVPKGCVRHDLQTLPHQIQELLNDEVRLQQLTAA